MVNPVLYQARTGCQWRYLPEEFGCWGAIWQQFTRWRDNHVWSEALDRLCRAMRVHAGRDPEPSMVCSIRRPSKVGAQLRPSMRPEASVGRPSAPSALF
jgi:transposase